MARKLNKNLVGVLTLLGMFLLAVIGFILIVNLPGQDPKIYEAQARELEQKGEYNRATQTYSRAYQRDPERNPEYLVMAAKSAVEDGQVGRARSLLTEALVRDSTLMSAIEFSAQLEFEIAQLFGGALHWTLVREKADRLIEFDDQSPLAHHALGLAYLNLQAEDTSYRQKGEENLRRALELDPTNVDVVKSLAAQLWVSSQRAQRERKTTEAQALEKAVESTLASAIEMCERLGKEEESAELKQLQAERAIFRGDIQRGLTQLEALATTETNNIDSRISLASLYAGFRRVEGETNIERAEELLSQALEMAPGDGRAYQLLGRLYRLQGKPEPEAALYRRGLEEIPHSDHFRLFRGNRHRVFFMTELFLQDLERASQAGRASDEAARTAALAAAEEWVSMMKEEMDEGALPVRLLNAYLFNAQGNHVAATAEAEAASRMTGADRNPGLQRLLAQLYMRRQQWGAARRALEKALSLSPDSSLLHTWMGRVQLELRRPAEALKWLKPGEAGSLREYLLSDEAAVTLRIKAYRDLGQFELASAEEKRLGTGSPIDKLRRADGLRAEGRNDEAERMIKAVLDADPENTEANLALFLLYRTTNRLTEATSLVKSQLARDPANPRYLRFEKTLALLEEEDETARDRMLEEFLKEEEDPFKRATGLFEFYTSRDRPDEAHRHLDEAERLRPEDPRVVERQLRAALVAEDWERADSVAARHGELNIDGTAGKVAEGRVAIAKGRFHQTQDRSEAARKEFLHAIELIGLGLETYPSYSLGWTYLAEAYLLADRVTEAKSALERALEIDPTNGFANRGMVDIAIRQGDQRAEEKYLVLAAKFLPNDTWVRRRLQLVAEKKNPEQGIMQREKIRKEDPKQVENLVFLARLYALPGIGEYEKASEVYHEALEASGNDLGLAREAAMFLAQEDVNQPAEGEALLKNLLKDEEDKAKKALIAIYLGQFYESQEALATADRYYRMAVSWDSSPGVLVLAAEFCSRTNRLSDALEYYERALTQIKEDPTQAESTRSRIIALLLYRGNLEKAKARIDEYIRMYPHDPQGRVFEGTYHRKGGDIRKSKEAFDTFLEEHPDSALALWQRGQLYRLMGRWQFAINDLKSAKAYSPNGLGYQHRIDLADVLVEAGRGAEAVAELRSILDEFPEQQGVAVALVGIYQRIRPARFGDAETLIYQYMRRYADDLRWPTLLGKLGEDSRDWDLAIQGYARAAEIGRYRGDAVSALCVTYKAANRPRELIRFVEEKLSARRLERLPRVLSSLAWAYARTGAKEKSFETYDRALAAAAGDAAAHWGIVKEMVEALGGAAVLARAKMRAESGPEDVERFRALINVLRSNGKYGEALAACERIAGFVVRDEDKVFVLMAQGMLLEGLGRHPEAKVKYESVLRIDPDQSAALNNLAYLLVEHMDNAAEAHPYAERAYRLRPNNPDVLDTIGWVLAKNNRLGEAAGMLLRALEIERVLGVHQERFVAAYHLGRVHMLRGEHEEAKLRLETAKVVAGEQEDARYLPKIIEALEELEKAGG